MAHPLVMPELDVSEWLNSPQPLQLSELRGKVVVIHAFQMLCPGCVSHGIPQASSIYNTFSQEDLVVLGLHTVFEHHAVMGPEALKAFVHEYRIAFPIGIDREQLSSNIPSSMQQLGLKGTPSMVVLDRQGAIRLHHFGRASDLGVGALLGTLIAERGSFTAAEAVAQEVPAQTLSSTVNTCTEEGCSL